MTVAREPRVAIKSPSGITPEEACDARARAWAYVFDCWEQKKVASADSGEEKARKEKYVSPNRTTS